MPDIRFHVRLIGQGFNEAAGINPRMPDGGRVGAAHPIGFNEAAGINPRMPVERV